MMTAVGVLVTAPVASQTLSLIHISKILQKHYGHSNNLAAMTDVDLTLAYTCLLYTSLLLPLMIALLFLFALGVTLVMATPVS